MFASVCVCVFGSAAGHLHRLLLHRTLMGRLWAQQPLEALLKAPSMSRPGLDKSRSGRRRKTLFLTMRSSPTMMPNINSASLCPKGVGQLLALDHPRPPARKVMAAATVSALSCSAKKPVTVRFSLTDFVGSTAESTSLHSPTIRRSCLS